MIRTARPTRHRAKVLKCVLWFSGRPRPHERLYHTFPNAKYLIGGTEWDFFFARSDPFLKDPVDDSVRPVMAEGMSEMVDDGYLCLPKTEARMTVCG